MPTREETHAPRKIVHLDADSFFASVERALDPSLLGKPIAVGGEPRGIIASASYEARKRGVYTPMATAAARRICPELIVVSSGYHFYAEYSRRMFEIISQFTPDIEQCSIDEGYFDLTCRREPMEELVTCIRDRIRNELHIPVSFGMGTNKLVTQIASKMNKPESFCIVPPGSEAMFVYPLSNRWLPGVGEKTGKALDRLGLYKVFHILKAPLSLLEMALGSYAPELKQYASGIDDRPLITEHEDAKSYGQQRTFENDLGDPAQVELYLKQMLDHLMEKIRADGKLIRTVTIRIRYHGMEDAQGSDSLSEPTCLEIEVYPILAPLLKRIWKKPLRIRMAGVKLSNIFPAEAIGDKLPLFAKQSGSKEARTRLAAAVDSLHNKLGWDAIKPAREMLLKTNPPDKHEDKKV